MNKTALLAIVTVCSASMLIAAKKQDDPAPMLTPEQIKALDDAGLEVVITHTEETGKGVGAGLTTEGDKIETGFDASAPMVGVGNNTASGGTSRSNARASAFLPPATMMENPLLWVGILCLLGAGAAFYFNLKRAAVVSGVAGAGFICAAMFPGVMLFVIAAIAVIVAGPYLYAEWKKKQAEIDANQHREALRAVVAGVEAAPPEAKAAVKEQVSKEADAADKNIIAEIKYKDKLV